MRKKLFLSILIATFSTGVFAQQIEEVTLTVSGDGATKEKATEVALRSAIEQAFGVFVSANTTIFDDELVKDEIATVSSGNIKKYEEIAMASLPDGNTTVTLKATVSVSKLISYAQSKGSSAEFAGATFGMNMKLKELNKANEEKAIENMISQFKALAPTMFDYELELGEPKVSSDGYVMSAKVLVTPNENAIIVVDILFNTLESLALTAEEIQSYEQASVRTYDLNIGSVGQGLYLIKHLQGELYEGYTPRNFMERKKLKQLKQQAEQEERERVEQAEHNNKLMKYEKFKKLGYVNLNSIAMHEIYQKNPDSFDDYLTTGSPGITISPRYDVNRNAYEDAYKFILRSEESQKLIKTFFNLEVYNDAVFGFKIVDNLNGISMIESVTVKQEGASLYKLIGEKTGLLGLWGFSGSSLWLESWLGSWYYGGPRGAYIPFWSEGAYIIKLLLRIPKDDIMKYNKFTITHK
jgi:hypothetical protein